MSKRDKFFGKKIALIVLRSVGPDCYRDVGQNQMCQCAVGISSRFSVGLLLLCRLSLGCHSCGHLQLLILPMILQLHSK